MKPELYQAWQQSHCIQSSEIDIADAVMQRITPQASKPNLVKQAWEVSLLNLFETRRWVQAVLLFLGALLGALRLFLQMASLLFA